MLDLPAGLTPLLVFTALICLSGFILSWLASVWLRDASLVDVYWGLGFVVLALSLTIRQGSSGATALLCGFVGLWGLRLSLHIGLRKLREPGEDRRYGAMRQSFGPGFWWKSLVYIYALQAALQWLVALPVTTAFAAGPDMRMGLVTAAGCAVFLAGFAIETVADWQLMRFKATRAHGDVCDVGLWRWSRHPNYFGEACLWWGLTATAWSLGAPWWTVISPLTMTYLLLRVSGVTLLEKDLSQSKPGYADYVRRTSAFILWPPKRDGGP